VISTREEYQESIPRGKVDCEKWLSPSLRIQVEECYIRRKLLSILKENLLLPFLYEMDKRFPYPVSGETIPSVHVVMVEHKIYCFPHETSSAHKW